jgi:hypothetical protein
LRNLDEVGEAVAARGRFDRKLTEQSKLIAWRNLSVRHHGV